MPLFHFYLEQIYTTLPLLLYTNLVPYCLFTNLKILKAHFLLRPSVGQDWKLDCRNKLYRTIVLSYIRNAHPKQQ